MYRVKDGGVHSSPKTEEGGQVSTQVAAPLEAVGPCFPGWRPGLMYEILSIAGIFMPPGKKLLRVARERAKAFAAEKRGAKTLGFS